MILFISLFACTGDFAIPRLMEDTGAYAEQDTGEDTETDTGEALEDTGDTGDSADDCRFELQTVDGTAEFGNELYQILSSSSPSGKINENESSEVMRFNVSATQGDCKMFTIADINMQVNVTDNNGTNWMLGHEVLIKNLSTGGIWMGPMYLNEDSAMNFTDDFGLPAGETHTLGVFMDTTGAGMDDTVQITIIKNGIVAWDVNGVHQTLLTDPITGNTVMID